MTINKNQISRRQLVKLLGVGTAVAASGAASGLQHLVAQAQTPTETPTPDATLGASSPTADTTTTPEVTTSPTIDTTATLEATVSPTVDITATPEATTSPTVLPTSTSEVTSTPVVTGTLEATSTVVATTPQPPATLDAQMKAVLDALAALNPPKLTTLSVFNARQTSPLNLAVQTILTQQNKPPLEPVAAIDHKLIPGGSGQQMLIRIYYPSGNGTFPALVYFHGGGFVIANLDTYDASCRALANAAGCAVISVAYRQAPEFRYPAAPLDALAAYRWVLQNGDSIRVDVNRVAVGGESAGGNLATVTALQARDRGLPLPVHQLLIYPVVNMYFSNPSPNFPSYAENVDAAPLATPALLWFYRLYLRRAFDAFSPYASPLRANVSGLPSATVITAQIDPLRDEGEAYATKLGEADVAVKLQRYEGVTHEFFGLGAVVDKAKQAVTFAATELKTAFGA